MLCELVNYPRLWAVPAPKPSQLRLIKRGVNYFEHISFFRVHTPSWSTHSVQGGRTWFQDSLLYQRRASGGFGQVDIDSESNKVGAGKHRGRLQLPLPEARCCAAGGRMHPRRADVEKMSNYRSKATFSTQAVHWNHAGVFPTSLYQALTLDPRCLHLRG